MADQLPRELLRASASAIAELAVSEHDPRLDQINALHDDTDYLAFDDDFVDPGTLACAAVGPDHCLAGQRPRRRAARGRAAATPARRPST